MPCFSAFLFHLDDHTAVLTPVAGLFILCFDLFKVGMFLSVRLVTFRAVTPLQFLGRDHQVAVPAPQPVFLLRYQNKIHMPARRHNTHIVKKYAYRFNHIHVTGFSGEPTLSIPRPAGFRKKMQSAAKE